MLWQTMKRRTIKIRILVMFPSFLIFSADLGCDFAEFLVLMTMAVLRRVMMM